MAALLEETKNVLNTLGLRPQKRRGQNFMTDGTALAAIADAAAAGQPETVLEIGPGLGFLTRELLSRGPAVVAVEKDRVLASFLRERFAGRPFRLIEGDILRTDIQSGLGLTGKITVAGNIPYNITSPILEWLISNRNRVSRAVLTVQREVALRLKAVPGTKAWGALTIFVQTYASVRSVRAISRNGFFPAPRVDSTVVELVFSEKPRAAIADEALFFKVVRRAFQKRRKTVINSLADPADKIFSKTNLSRALAEAQLDGRRRPETFSIPEWARLCYTYAKVSSI